MPGPRARNAPPRYHADERRQLYGLHTGDGGKVSGVLVIYTHRCTLCTRMLCTAPGQVCADCKAMMCVSARHAGGPFSRFLRAAVLAGRIALCLLGLSFIAYFIVVPFLGGDALSGCIEHGHYYLAFKPGCRARTEVSRAVFEYSRWHTFLMLVM
jgi:hypothetical protein